MSGGHRQGDEGELPVDQRHDDNHSHQQAGGADQRREAVDGNPLDGGGVPVDAKDGVGCAVSVVVGERQSLDVAEDAGAEVQQQPLAGVSAQPRAGEALKLVEQGDGQEQKDRQQEFGSRGAGCRFRQEHPQEAGHRLRSRETIDGNLQRQRREQDNGRGQEATKQQ